MDEDKVAELHSKISELRAQLRDHGEKVSDPRCAALCETSAEVMGGLETAFGHFRNKSEKAWDNIPEDNLDN